MFTACSFVHDSLIGTQTQVTFITDFWRFEDSGESL